MTAATMPECGMAHREDAVMINEPRRRGLRDLQDEIGAGLSRPAVLGRRSPAMQHAGCPIGRHDESDSEPGKALPEASSRSPEQASSAEARR
jgi:hypothetical protein